MINHDSSWLNSYRCKIFLCAWLETASIMMVMKNGGDNGDDDAGGVGDDNYGYDVG